MGARITKWENVGVRASTVSLSSVTGSTATAITRAAEGVVSMSGHSFENGDYLWVTCDEGMWQLNDRIVRVADAATDTFTMENIKTLYFDDAEENKTSFFKIPWWNINLITAMSVSGGGTSHEMLDATTIHQSRKVEVPGMVDAGTYNLENIWDPTNAGLLHLKDASDAQRYTPFMFRFGQGEEVREMVFVGMVGCNLMPTGAAQQIAKTPVAITMQGSPSFYVTDTTAE